MMNKKITAIMIGLAMTGATLGGGIYNYVGAEDKVAVQADMSDTGEGISNTASIKTVQTASDESDSDFSYSNVADVAEQVMPSVVAITNESVEEVRDFFSGRSMQYESESAGSGIIVGSNDTELLIVTNNHVVENANELTVSFVDDAAVTAQVKGTDPANDLAVIAVKLEDISDETMDAIKVATIGDSDQMRVGEQVVAIGNALGYGQSVTTGIISAKDRSIDVADEGSMMTYEDEASTYSDLIQTDAAINPGNSGGALLNMNGEVIGINSAKASASGVEGMGYAIPISKAMPILQDLMNKETRSVLDESEMGYIGIRGQSVSNDATSLYGIPSGVYVTSVTADGPAEKAGLQEGDIITKFDGEALSGMQDLQNKLRYYAAGEEVELTIYTKADGGTYKESSLTITLGDRSELEQQQ